MLGEYKHLNLSAFPTFLIELDNYSKLNYMFF